MSAIVRRSLAPLQPRASWSIPQQQQPNKPFSNKENVKHAAAIPDDTNFESARAFEDIPGPSKFQLFRNFLPGGSFRNSSFSKIFLDLHEQYGPLVRFPGLFGKPDMYSTINPDDFSVVFRNEGAWPFRRGFDTLVYYREVYKKDFFQGIEGILSTQGEKWATARTAVNPILMQPKNVHLYLDAMLDVNDEFLARIREIRNPNTLEMPDTFEDEINRLTLETVAAVALNKNLGLLRKNRDAPELKAFMTSLRNFFELGYQLDFMPSFWKIVKTPKFYEMMNTLDTILDICCKYINESLARIEKGPTQEGRETSVLEKLTLIDKKLAVVMAMDMMFAGVDTSSTTLVGILFCLAKNPDKQEALLKELLAVMPRKDSRLTVQSIRNLPYLRACIKEAIRMYPILAGTSRKLPHDIVLSGYRFKGGNEIVIPANLLLANEKYVPQADEYLPDRWLRQENHTVPDAIANPFMYVPFGFGPRSCAGKRIVNLELEVTIARLVRNFQVQFNYPLDNAFKSRLINVPNIPLNYKFEERIE